METSKKIGIIVLFALGMSIFGYSQYASASQIGVNVIQSEIFEQDEKGSEYNIELEFENPSLLLLTAGKTEFFLISNDEIVGKGDLESFILQPLNTSIVKGTFYADSDRSEKLDAVSISGIIKYDLSITTIDVPLVYYPTEEQEREFIHQD